MYAIYIAVACYEGQLASIEIRREEADNGESGATP